MTEEDEEHVDELYNIQGYCTGTCEACLREDEKA